MLIAPCGSGKTKFAINYITSGKYKLGRILYVIDVNNNKDHFMSSYPEIFTTYDKSWMGELYRSQDNWVNFTNSPLFQQIDGQNAQVTIINYTQLGALLSHYPTFYTMLDLVILDEPHHFFKYNARYINTPLSHSQLVYTALKHMATEQFVEVVAITATPGKFLQYMPSETIYTVPYDTTRLTRYLTSTPVHYTTPNKAIKDILAKYPSPHILVYTPYIRSMQNLEQLFTSHGLNVVCLWSRNNTKYPYSPTQQQVYDHLLQHKVLPDSTNVVILNAAFETGMDINDTRFDVFWGQSSDVDSLVQARGRIRGDIQHSVVVTKQMYWEKIQGQLDWGKESWRKGNFSGRENSCGIDSGEEETRLEGGDGETGVNIVPVEYLNIFLTTQDKNKLCSILEIKDSNRRMLKWTGVKQYLINHGYEIISTRKTINKKRVKGDIISKR